MSEYQTMDVNQLNKELKYMKRKIESLLEKKEKLKIELEQVNVDISTNLLEEYLILERLEELEWRVE